MENKTRNTIILIAFVFIAIGFVFIAWNDVSKEKCQEFCNDMGETYSDYDGLYKINLRCKCYDIILFRDENGKINSTNFTIEKTAWNINYNVGVYP